ncbi:MAG: sigma-70 family RNA polymerase sigma factor [Blastocatellia bacterium]
MTERRLIEACQQGDREAFRQLFEAYRDRVWSVALHFTGDETAARDITQQVFLKLFTSIAQFRHDANFATWLYRLVVNLCLDEQRRRRRFISFDFFRSGNDDDGEIELKDWRTPLHSQEELFTRLEISGAVKAAVKQLSPKLRMAILLKYFEELTYEEMAEVLGCSPGTVASRLSRGHRELARRLDHLRAGSKPGE